MLGMVLEFVVMAAFLVMLAVLVGIASGVV